MIQPDARITIARIPIMSLQCKEYQKRFLSQLCHYVQLLQAHPESDPGILHVTPSDTHPGMYCVLDGHTRLCAAILTGRKDLLCAIIENRDQYEKGA